MSRKLSVVLAMLALLATASSFAANPHLDDPSDPGPYGVGFTQFPLTLTSGGQTTINLWYPIDQSGSPQGDTYSATVGVFGLSQSLSIPSPAAMLRDAPIASGVYPLILQVHGGGNVAPPTDLNGLIHLKNNEALASHGFVVAAYTRRNFFLGLDAKTVIDAATLHFPAHIDSNAIGVAGESAGNREASALAAGASFTPPGGATIVLPADARVKAVLYQDGGNSNRTSPEQFAAMTTDYLMLSGSALSPVAGVAEQLATTISVSPRKQVIFAKISHLSLGSGLCAIIDAAREDALAKQQLAGPALRDPLNNFVAPQIPGGSVSGVLAFFNWNFISLTGQPDLGEAAEFCSRVGVDDIRLSSDLDGDGIADAYTGNNANGEPVLDADTINRLHQRYAVAFWKVHLKGDNKYKAYLTPGFVANDDRVSVSVTGGNGS